MLTAVAVVVALAFAGVANATRLHSHALQGSSAAGAAATAADTAATTTAAAAVAAATAATGSRPIKVHPTQDSVHRSSGDGTPTLRRRAQANGIAYHNGAVMLGTVKVFYIFYGNWAGNTGVQILTDFMSNLGKGGA